DVSVVGGDGVVRRLVEGDRVYIGDRIVTGQEQGAVAIRLDQGGELTLGRGSNLLLDSSFLDNAQVGRPAPADGPPSAPSAEQLSEVQALQEAIAAGADPTATAEASAAGPGAGAAPGNAGGGHSFVLLQELGG